VVEKVLFQVNTIRKVEHGEGESGIHQHGKGTSQTERVGQANKKGIQRFESAGQK